MFDLALTLAAVCSAPQEPEPPQLSQAALHAWSEHLAPTDDEDRWRQIPWRQSVGDGLTDAARAKKPMLLWLMNGHPLGCT